MSTSEHDPADAAATTETPGSAEPEPGRARVVAGRYRLQSVLGSGSMGTVWSAYDEFLHRPVAVKEVRLPPGVPPSRAAELRERTLREARAIAVLSHPNVIILHDVARENDEPFVVMELLPGPSLAALLRDHGSLSPPQAAAVADAVGSALEAAHTAGITHRDVKPGNVLVARDGRIKLNDFGIARNVSEATMTRTGMMLGSPAYIAPEVASGGAVTPAADLWGLGATLFAAVEGRPPYDADGDPLETVNRVVHGEAPQPGPGPLGPVIRGLMAKEPGSRMPLREVRRRLYPLLAQPRHTLFGPELFAESSANTAPDRGDTTATQVISAPALPEPPKPEAGQAGAGGAPAGGGELAADPGPLPFESPSHPVSQEPVGARPRGPLPGVAVTVVAVLLFLAAAFGGFVLTRVVAAQPLGPPQRTDAGPTAPPLRELAPRRGDATNLRGARGGLFSVQVPEDWTKFVSGETGGGLPPRTLVQFVSSDGTQSFDVERFDSEPLLSPDVYWNALGKLWGGNLRQVEYAPLTDGRRGLLLSYRTVESSPVRPGEQSERPLNRTTFAHVFQAQDSLWVVGLTVPTDQEETARTRLFDRIMPTFQIIE